jgi:hypothetical protein
LIWDRTPPIHEVSTWKLGWVPLPGIYLACPLGRDRGAGTGSPAARLGRTRRRRIGQKPPISAQICRNRARSPLIARWLRARKRRRRGCFRRFFRFRRLCLQAGGRWFESSTAHWSVPCWGWVFRHGLLRAVVRSGGKRAGTSPV